MVSAIGIFFLAVFVGVGVLALVIFLLAKLKNRR